MKLLLHTCCGPCLLFPLDSLKSEGFSVTGFFFNPNIHPYKEFKKRIDSLISYADSKKFPLILEKDYDLSVFLRKVVFKEDKRCSICYDHRLLETVKTAKLRGFTHFSTTLLYSKYQQHELIKSKCVSLASEYDLNFVYRDFRDGWEKGIELSIREELYRQPYCGCIYSEQERYDNRLKKKLRKQKKNS